jgi:hypothetical protein
MTSRYHDRRQFIVPTALTSSELPTPTSVIAPKANLKLLPAIGIAILDGVISLEYQ